MEKIQISKELALTALIALKAEELRLRRYEELYPDGGWSGDATSRISDAVDELRKALDKKVI